MSTDMDERHFDPEATVFGQPEPTRTPRFAAAKVDLWCAESVLANAADSLRRAAGLPATAPTARALHIVDEKAAAGNQRAARAAAAFRDAATRYEGARTGLDHIRINNQ
jgi:hypothetical protein